MRHIGFIDQFINGVLHVVGVWGWAWICLSEIICRHMQTICCMVSREKLVISADFPLPSLTCFWQSYRTNLWKNRSPGLDVQIGVAIFFFISESLACVQFWGGCGCTPFTPSQIQLDRRIGMMQLTLGKRWNKYNKVCSWIIIHRPNNTIQFSSVFTLAWLTDTVSLALILVIFLALM